MVKRVTTGLAPCALLGLAILALATAGCGGGGGPTTPVVHEGTLVIRSTPPGAKVFINGTDTEQRTPIEITREVQPAGTSFTVTARLTGYDDGTATVVVKPNEAVPVDLTLTPARPPEIPPHTITGRVLLQQGGGTTPATAATVTATETTSGEVYAAVLDSSPDRLGTYYIYALPGTYRVAAESAGYQAQARDVTIVSGDDRKTGIDFTLTP